MLAGRVVLAKGLLWRVGNGAITRFRLDCWTADGPLLQHCKEAVSSELLNVSVREFLENSSLLLPMINSMLPSHIVGQVLANPGRIRVDHEDILIWLGTSTGELSLDQPTLDGVG